MPSNDLWGDLPIVETIRTPVIILKEQAELLKSKTEGLLIGKVAFKQAGNDQFRINFHIIAPTLNNYTYHLFEIHHPIGFYPLVLRIPGQTEKICNDESEFTELLRSVLTSDNTRSVISKLLTHINSTVSK